MAFIMYYLLSGIGGGLILLSYIIGYFMGVYTDRTLKPIRDAWGGVPVWLFWVSLVACSVVYINIVVYSELDSLRPFWVFGSSLFWLGAVSWVGTLRYHQSSGSEFLMELSLRLTALGSLVWFAAICIHVGYAVWRDDASVWKHALMVLCGLLSFLHHLLYDAIYWYNGYL